MFGSSIIEVAIGLIFVYLLMSLICSAANEIIESFLKNRATDLERGIRELFNQSGGDGLVAAFYKHPLIDGLFRGMYKREKSEKVGFFDYLWRTDLPSYIPARNFSFAVLDLMLHPPSDANASRDDKPGGTEGAAVVGAVLPVTMEAVRLAIRKNMGDTQVGRAMRTLAEQAGDDLNALRANIEAWFDGSMDRVSGTYKRRTKWIIFTIGFTLTILLNANTITIARRLSNDTTLRNLVVAQAEAFAKQPNATTPDLQADRAALDQLGLPLGWPEGIEFYPFAKSGRKLNPWDHILLPLLGWLLTAGAISLGAPFWFDLLNKFMVIRATVKPHEKSPEEGSEDRQQSAALALIGAGNLATRVPAQASASPAGATPPTSSSSSFTPSPEPDLGAAPDEEDNESHLDGCDVEVTDPTPDEDLPPTTGGVA
jgi:hypothetical protein